MATQSIVDMVFKSQTTGSMTGVSRTATSANNVNNQERQALAAEQKHAEQRAEQIEMSRNDLENVVSQLKDYVQSMQRDMDFHVDDATGRVVIQVIDSNSNEVIRQIPSEEILAIARHLADSLENNDSKGFFIELKA